MYPSTDDSAAAVQDPELQECQAAMALALARLSLNAATQFTLIGRGLATAIARMIAHAPSTSMPAVSTIIMAVVAEGHSQGAVLVRAGVGAPPPPRPARGPPSVTHCSCVYVRMGTHRNRHSQAM